MTADPDSNIVQALVNLTEALDSVNTMIRRQAEERMDQPLVPIVEVAILGYLLRHPGANLRTIISGTGLPIATVPGALRSLESRDLISNADTKTRSANSGYRATQKGIDLRAEARAHSAKQMRYALASISVGVRDDLESVTDGINALAIALGWQDIDPSYQTDPASES
ncbi:hypothetical protein SAMN05892883_2876 [Jatrophihabitans sp. GAS493]|uniref:hypothetical protein n=1 Tax=Jatrophihabitans sp. GAS493 TaxID=1907575 RepID=UPI000BB9B5EB|nr:hypothetical protein [Jatrophihabitans sp. GAS493]SOD73588.1 hypothetical protein SAMN05892883_2876 [Jatrophihabitans sp. GAS493]